MDITIQSVHFDATEQLNSFIQKKVKKLAKFHDEIDSAEVVLKVVKPEVALNKEAGIKLIAPGGEFYANKIRNSFEEAIDECIDALEKQLAKHKEKQRKKIKRNDFFAEKK